MRGRGAGRRCVRGRGAGRGAERCVGEGGVQGGVWEGGPICGVHLVSSDIVVSLLFPLW